MRTPSRSPSSFERAAAIALGALAAAIVVPPEARAGKAAAAMQVSATVADSARVLVEGAARVAGAGGSPTAGAGGAGAAASRLGVVSVVCTGAGGPSLSLAARGPLAPASSAAPAASGGARSTYRLPLAPAPFASAGVILVAIDF